MSQFVHVSKQAFRFVCGLTQRLVHPQDGPCYSSLHSVKIPTLECFQKGTGRMSEIHAQPRPADEEKSPRLKEDEMS
jgi:hypothetical protein